MTDISEAAVAARVKLLREDYAANILRRHDVDMLIALRNALNKAEAERDEARRLASDHQKYIDYIDILVLASGHQKYIDYIDILVEAAEAEHKEHIRLTAALETERDEARKERDVARQLADDCLAQFTRERDRRDAEIASLTAAWMPTILYSRK